MSLSTEVIKNLIGSPSDFGIGWLLLLAAATITILTSLSGGLKYVISHLIKPYQEKRRHLKIISQLDSGNHISHFQMLLGNPVAINEINFDREYIFVNQYYYTQAIANLNGEVLLFSITTRKGKFHPVAKGQYNSFAVELGETRFSQLNEPKETFTNGDHGAITSYSETHYMGIDGAYRTYIFSFNPMGYGKLPHVPEWFLLWY